MIMIIMIPVYTPAPDKSHLPNNNIIIIIIINDDDNDDDNDDTVNDLSVIPCTY